jgi:ubiquinone/menaquinone biosynthesis C-methylase UbiE
MTLPPAILRRLLRIFFRLLYHEMAWSYDLVASVVSLGRWHDWVSAALPFVDGPRVLELAFGSGRLQVALRQGHHTLVSGIDESRQMAHLARRRLHGLLHEDRLLIQARAQALPYRAHAFGSVVATFPTEFILDGTTLHEVQRVLVPSGKFVIVAAAWILSRQVLDRAAAWLFRSTRQSPQLPPTAAGADYATPLARAGFKTDIRCVQVRGSTVLILLASK